MLSHNDLLHIRATHRCCVSFSLAGKGLLKICKHLSSVWKWKVSNVALKLLIFTYFYQQLLVFELAGLSHGHSSKDSKIQHGYCLPHWSPPPPGSSTHHFLALAPQGLQWLRAHRGWTTSQGAQSASALLLGTTQLIPSFACPFLFSTWVGIRRSRNAHTD